VRALLIGECLPDPSEEAARTFHLDSEHAISMRESEHIRVPAANRDLVGLTPIQDIRVRVLMRSWYVDEWLVIACFEFVNDVPEDRRFVHRWMMVGSVGA
jgi:hypothetical protein